MHIQTFALLLFAFTCNAGFLDKGCPLLHNGDMSFDLNDLTHPEAYTTTLDNGEVLYYNVCGISSPPLESCPQHSASYVTDKAENYCKGVAFNPQLYMKDEDVIIEHGENSDLTIQIRCSEEHDFLELNAQVVNGHIFIIAQSKLVCKDEGSRLRILQTPDSNT